MTVTHRVGRPTAGGGRVRRAFSSIARTAVLAAGLALAVTTVKSPPGTSISLIGEAKASTPKRVRDYSTKTDPFSLDSKLKRLAKSVPSGNTKAKVSWIFKKLNRYASGGVKVLSMTGKAPRTAAQALAKGGDCTDLTNIYIAIAKRKKIPGGVLLVHFNTAPKNKDHLVPYALISGKKVIVDLQNRRLGKTAQGKYRVLMDVTFAQAEWMYHREMGDYFKIKKKRSKAMKAYKRSLQLNDKDPHVHQNVAVLYRDAGDHISALKHIKKAVALDSSYKKYLPGATFNASLQAGQKAYNEGRFADCAKHFTAALNSGHKMSAANRKAIKQNISLCKSKASGR